jgi:hypothetical protein
MKRKYKKTKKEHARRNATIKRKKRTRRQRAGAYIENVDLRDTRAFPIDKREYNIIETENYENGSPKYKFEGKARALVIHPPCGAQSRCPPPSVSYRIVDGHGILTWYNHNGTIHSVYEGEFVDGKKNGHGKNTFHTHPVFKEYEGEFEDGEMHGKGTMMMTNEDVYVGDFQRNLMHGTGTMTFQENDSRYVGDWDQGRMHGVGDVYDDKGTLVFKARFENNQPIEDEAPPAPAPAPAGNITPAFFDPSSRR